MPKAKCSLIGKKFGRLTAVSVDRVVRKNYTYYLCTCKCGGSKSVFAGNLTAGQTRSCGCKSTSVTHGKSRTSIYRTWARMHARCRRPTGKNTCYKGVRVCKRWRKFENFFADMGEKPSPKLSIDRIDNDKGYSPDNCRWATASVQRLNQRRMARV